MISTAGQLFTRPVGWIEFGQQVLHQLLPLELSGSCTQSTTSACSKCCSISVGGCYGAELNGCSLAIDFWECFPTRVDGVRHQYKTNGAWDENSQSKSHKRFRWENQSWLLSEREHSLRKEARSKPGCMKITRLKFSARLATWGQIKLEQVSS